MKYCCVKEQLADEETGSYTAYAVAVELDGNRIRYISDAFSDYEQALRFIALCNALLPSPIHLREMIEDFIVSERQ